LSLVAETQVLTWMTAHSTVLFPAVFFGVALFEAFRPARPQTTPLALRWFGNVGVFFLGWPLLKAIPFLSVTGAAMIAGQHGVGLFNVLSIPAVVAIPAGVVVLDLTLYWEHRLLHWFPPFWRIHALHHSDTDLDVASYIRHHPFEMVLQALFDVLVVMALGLSAVSVALLTAISIVVQMTAHSNIELPRPLRRLSFWVVTPELHRLFGTLCLRPQGELKLGLPEFADAKFQRLDKMLLLPLLISSGPVTAPASDLKT
jgi:sterol desaturase/sphingolipid hydroxylase (fatty acid hydroxylase superfamily)